MCMLLLVNRSSQFQSDLKRSKQRLELPIQGIFCQLHSIFDWLVSEGNDSQLQKSGVWLFQVISIVANSPRISSPPSSSNSTLFKKTEGLLFENTFHDAYRAKSTAYHCMNRIFDFIRILSQRNNTSTNSNIRDSKIQSLRKIKRLWIWYSNDTKNWRTKDFLVFKSKETKSRTR